MKKFCISVREHSKKLFDFQKNVTFNRRRVKSASRCTSMLHLWTKYLEDLSKIMNYRKVRYHWYYIYKKI